MNPSLISWSNSDFFTVQDLSWTPTVSKNIQLILEPQPWCTCRSAQVVKFGPLGTQLAMKNNATEPWGSDEHFCVEVASLAHISQAFKTLASGDFPIISSSNDAALLQRNWNKLNQTQSSDLRRRASSSVRLRDWLLESTVTNLGQSERGFMDVHPPKTCINMYS